MGVCMGLWDLGTGCRGSLDGAQSGAGGASARGSSEVSHPFLAAYLPRSRTVPFLRTHPGEGTEGTAPGPALPLSLPLPWLFSLKPSHPTGPGSGSPTIASMVP